MTDSTSTATTTTTAPSGPGGDTCRGCGERFPGSRDTFTVSGRIEHLSCYDPRWDVSRRLWVDDLRVAPTGWKWATTSLQAIAEMTVRDYDEISLDHDLGGVDTTRNVVIWMCANDKWPATVYIHTQNPVGREWLVGMVERYGPGVSR